MDTNSCFSKNIADVLMRLLAHPFHFGSFGPPYLLYFMII